MNNEEYKRTREELKSQHKKELDQLAEKHALLNNKIKSGDVVSDGSITISVDKITVGYYVYNEIPMCVYRGPELTQNLKPYKNGSWASIYQCQVETINGEAVK